MARSIKTEKETTPENNPQPNVEEDTVPSFLAPAGIAPTTAQQ